MTFTATRWRLWRYIECVKSSHRSPGLRAIVALVLVLASVGAETAHGSAHLAQLHAAEDAHEHETLHSLVSIAADKDHGHERVSDGIAVRSSQWGIIAFPAQPELVSILGVLSPIPGSNEQHVPSVATGPPPRLRAPPVA